jgi:hypothetical protein
MPLRDVVLTFDTNEVVGDETYELWLKIAAGEWALFQTGAVALTATQSFTLLDLEEGVAHAAQVRMLRGGRYRSDYLSGDPDLWPSQSLIEFTPGLEESFGTPSINATAWSRTASDSQRITVTATAAAGSEAYAIQLLRDGVVVDEVAGPHVGTTNLVDLNPPIAEVHDYTVRHASGVLEGPTSGVAQQYAGPNAPTGLVQGVASWYQYSLQWDAPESGAVTEYGDDYLCPGNINSRGTTAADATMSGTVTVEKESALEPNGNTPCTYTGYARHKVTAFTVEDVSQWEQITVEHDIANDETAYLSCP